MAVKSSDDLRVKTASKSAKSAALSLQNSLERLKLENAKLLRDLQLKKKEAVARKKQYKIDREQALRRMDNISKEVETSRKSAQTQKVILNEAVAALESKESKLSEIAGRMNRLEAGEMQEGESVSRLKEELLSLLGDVKNLRNKREKINASLSRNNPPS